MAPMAISLPLLPHPDRVERCRATICEVWPIVAVHVFIVVSALAVLFFAGIVFWANSQGDIPGAIGCGFLMIISAGSFVIGMLFRRALMS
jgi:hypothetical protein